MKQSNYIKIFTGNFAIVKRIVMELNAIDINPVVKDQAESAILGGFGGTLAPDFQEVFVHISEVEKTTPIIYKLTQDLNLENN